MLFNSHEFIFLFLPFVLLGFYFLIKLNRLRWSILWLVASSLFFYGWWNPKYLYLITLSVVANYILGSLILSRNPGHLSRKILLIMGIVLNLSLLCYFKYANFFIQNLNQITAYEIVINPIVLPIAISFYTFQQITFLVDSFRSDLKKPNFLHYCLFVTFFPQLIAGPIVHHKEMIPQFANKKIFRFELKNIAVGFTIFIIGLFKKVIIADGISTIANSTFDAAYGGMELALVEAWAGIFAYSFQIYFDFSGYSDMAIGLARLFGIRLPINFNSPYKARNIARFWQRWHMTLSRLLREYLYFPLGGNRKGAGRKNMNLLVVMFLGGLWHGASWLFVVWGLLHGAYLLLLKKFESTKNSVRFIAREGMRNACATITTFIGVSFAWIFFRSPDFPTAVRLVKASIGLNGLTRPVAGEVDLIGFDLFLYSFFVNPHFKIHHIAWFIGLVVIVWFLPNTQQIMAMYRPGIRGIQKIKRSRLAPILWKPTTTWAIVVSCMLFLSIFYLNRKSEFLYFQF